MKPVQIVVVLLVVGLAAVGGWFAGHSSQSGGRTFSTTDTGQVYSCSMHPQIRSPKPGKCPICLMELASIHSGRSAVSGLGVVMLNSNSITAINVATVAVKRHPLHRAMRAAGTIDDNDAQHRIVAAPFEGRVERLNINYVGAEVVAGQTLATFYSPVLLAAEREYVLLLRRQPADSPVAAEYSRLVEATAQRLKRYGLSDDQLAALPNKSGAEMHSELVAPTTGTVVARQVYEGQYVKEGEKLFELADFSTMWFLFDAYERDLIWLKPGQKVDVTTPALPGKVFAGRIAFIDPNLKEMTRSAKIRVELANPLIEEEGRKHRELYHKLYAEALVHLEIPQVLAVPRSAVLARGTEAVVYVENGDTSYERRRVKLGRVGDDAWEVLDGLHEDERVVVSGNMLIDAQAQLNSGSAGDSETDGTTGINSLSPPDGEQVGTGNGRKIPPLTEEQQKAAKEFLTFATTLTSSLAADDLAEFNRQAAAFPRALSALASVFPKKNPWRRWIDAMESAHLASANDLKSARKTFHPLSEAAVQFAKVLRQQEASFKTLAIYRCPMTKDAFPGAPRTAHWLQFQPPIRNPYFGAEMLDCGSEVK